MTGRFGLAASFIRYAIVGGTGTAAHYAVLFGMVETLRVSPVVASTAGAVVGAMVNYVLNRRFTFRSVVAHRRAAPRFFGIAAAGAVLNGLLMWFLVRYCGIQYLIAQVATTVVLLGITFLLNRAWTFAPRSSHSG